MTVLWAVPAAAVLLAATFACESRYARTKDATWAGYSFAAMLCLVGLTIWVLGELAGAKA